MNFKSIFALVGSNYLIDKYFLVSKIYDKMLALKAKIIKLTYCETKKKIN